MKKLPITSRVHKKDLDMLHLPDALQLSEADFRFCFGKQADSVLKSTLIIAPRLKCAH